VYVREREMKREGGEREEGVVYWHIGCMEVRGTDLMEFDCTMAGLWGAAPVLPLWFLLI